MNKKFRIWNKPKNRFVSGCLITEDGLVCLIEKYEVFSLPKNQDDYVAQQWTGLTDSQGVEIYEGDIVSFHPQKEDYSMYKGREDCLISWKDNDSHYGFFIESRAGNFMWSLSRRFCEKSTSVIGNIFQTPELLEK